MLGAVLDRDRQARLVTGASVDLAVDVVEGRGAQVDDQVLVGDPAQVFGVLALESEPVDPRL